MILFLYLFWVVPVFSGNVSQALFSFLAFFLSLRPFLQVDSFLLVQVKHRGGV